MANRPTPPPNSAGMECYPGTDMTGVEMELLRELMRKAERQPDDDTDSVFAPIRT